MRIWKFVSDLFVTTSRLYPGIYQGIKFKLSDMAGPDIKALVRYERVPGSFENRDLRFCEYSLKSSLQDRVSPYIIHGNQSISQLCVNIYVEKKRGYALVSRSKYRVPRAVHNGLNIAPHHPSLRRFTTRKQRAHPSDLARISESAAYTNQEYEEAPSLPSRKAQC